MIEFDCRDCGIHVVDVVGERTPAPPLCLTCKTLPGWTMDDKLRAILGAHLPPDRVPDDIQ